jgi:hypothetical protein
MEGWEPYLAPLMNSCRAFGLFTRQGIKILTSGNWMATALEEPAIVRLAQFPTNHPCDGSIQLTYGGRYYHLIFTDHDRVIAYSPVDRLVVIHRSARVLIVAEFEARPFNAAALAHIVECSIDLFKDVGY